MKNGRNLSYFRKAPLGPLTFFHVRVCASTRSLSALAHSSEHTTRQSAFLPLLGVVTRARFLLACLFLFWMHFRTRAFIGRSKSLVGHLHFYYFASADWPIKSRSCSSAPAFRVECAGKLENEYRGGCGSSFWVKSCARDASGLQICINKLPQRDLWAWSERLREYLSFSCFLHCHTDTPQTVVLRATFFTPVYF